MRSLLKDLRAAAQGKGPGDPLRALREAVVDHLRDLCTTPRGASLLEPECGLDDATRLFHEYPTSTGDMQRDLFAMICRFEPRLRNVSVTHIKTDDLGLRLRFDVAGVLVDDAGRLLPVQFSTVIDSDNHVELR